MQPSPTIILPDAHNCAQVTLSGTNQTTTKWQNKLHFSYPAGYSLTASDISNLLLGVQSAWTTDIAPLCNTTVLLTLLQGIDLNSRTGAIGSLVPVTPPAGTRTGTMLTAQNALVASWQIQNRYRGGHPRTYWPAGTQADTVNGSLWTNTFRSLASSNFIGFVTALNAISVATGHFTFIMLSYFSGSHKVPGQPPPPPVLRPSPVPFPISQIAVPVHPRIDTQRRRLGKEVP